ncbi:MAG TPA: DNA repair protein RecN [Steroidobacteraceae bacterium]|nr:DNA repair protein RecN [Steroidobacteraceae bacterium]
MLTHLQIRDFAIIDSVELELASGLTVLTGETGAGKSILVDALQLLAGGRAGAEVVRVGAERAEISGSFDLTNVPRSLVQWLEEQSISALNELIVRRVIGADGRSRGYLNGQSVPLQLLREAGDILIDLHGQHEFQSLTRSTAQRELLDGYGALTNLTSQVGIAHRVWTELLNRTLELDSKARDRDARLDLLRYQLRELKALELKEGELESLSAERARLTHRGRLATGTQTAIGELYENDAASAHAALSRALAALKGLAGVDAKLAAVLPMLEEAVIVVRETARELEHYRESLDVDATRQEEVERRLAAIEELARKHRTTPAQLSERTAELDRELTALERADLDLEVLRKELASALEGYRVQAGELTAKRIAAARALARDITSRMQTLGMTGGRFEVDVTQAGNAEPARHGIDQIEFRVTANPGHPPRALAKVASGGELARLSLAVQVACAMQDARSMVFDEVDAGIGGAVAEIVGRELRTLGGRAQVLCVTHLPQVACQAHHHIRVTKLSDGRTTRITAATLSGEDRVEELARMLGGVEITPKAREHARDMLASATYPPPSRSSGATGAHRVAEAAPDSTADTAQTLMLPRLSGGKKGRS